MKRRYFGKCEVTSCLCVFAEYERRYPHGKKNRNHPCRRRRKAVYTGNEKRTEFRKAPFLRHERTDGEI